MKLFEVDAIAMALVEEDGKKRWVIHGKSGGDTYKVVIHMGDDQYRLIDADTATAMELPCA